MCSDHGSTFISPWTEAEISLGANNRPCPLEKSCLWLSALPMELSSPAISSALSAQRFPPKQSQAPALISDSKTFLLAARRSILPIKSSQFLKPEPFFLASTMVSADPAPTFFMARRPNLILPSSIQNLPPDFAISGGRTSMPDDSDSCRYPTSLLSSFSLPVTEWPISEFIRAVMYRKGKLALRYAVW